MAYRRLLIGPTPAELVAALREATREANRPQTILDFADGWDDFVANLGSRRDGRRQWSDARRGDTAGVGVTWWTDHVGRRHVRVTGAGPHDPQRHVSTRNDPRPPLWHLYPDRVYYRERGGLGEWWGVCACGVAGRPEAVAWMGQSCGPCHDRTEEGVADEGGPTIPLTHQGGRLPPVFSPSGAMLAVILDSEPDGNRVRVHDLDAGTYIDLPGSSSLFSAPAFSPDGLIAFTTEYSALHVHDLITGERLRLEDATRFRRQHLAFSPDGKYLAAAGADGFRVWERQEGEGEWRVVEEVQGAVLSLAFAPDGRQLAVGLEQSLLLVDPAGGTQARDVPEAVPQTYCVEKVTFGPDGRDLFVMSGRTILTRGDQGPTICRWKIDTIGATCLARVELRSAYQHSLSSCGKYLSANHYDDVKTACLLDTATGQELGRVGWDVAEHITAAVFAPDGRTLALVDATGTLKLVPWAALLT